jgi:hypothetical protein
MLFNVFNYCFRVSQGLPQALGVDIFYRSPCQIPSRANEMTPKLFYQQVFFLLAQQLPYVG